MGGGVSRIWEGPGGRLRRIWEFFGGELNIFLGPETSTKKGAAISFFRARKKN